MNLSELIKLKLAEHETEEDKKLRERDDTEHPYLSSARQTKASGTRADRRRKVSYQTLVRRAHAGGYPNFSRAHLAKLVRGDMKTFPNPDTIYALKAALGVSAEIVTAATAAHFGINMYALVGADGRDVVVLAKGEGSGERTPVELDRSAAAVVDATARESGPR